MRAWVVINFCCGLLLFSVHQVRAEIFELTNSAKIRGELLNAEELPRKSYIIKTLSGGEVTLEASQVKHVIHETPAQLEYDEVAPRYADTVEGQWQLSEWCREHKLTTERKNHLGRIIELDANHKEARVALGYSFVDGTWVRPDDLMKQKGYQYYNGKWMLPQEIELMEAKRKDELAEKEWLGKLKRWRDDLSSRDPLKADKAAENIRSIRDPYAVVALSDYLNREPERTVSEWYFNDLEAIATTGAFQVLAVHAIENTDVELRLAALEKLSGKQLPTVTAFFLGGLHSKDNVRVNRSGYALGRLQDPSAIPALIDALVTKHKFSVQTGPPPGSTSATFDKNGGGGGGLAVGGSPPKIITQELQNPEVHAALTQLTGVDYSYDLALWHRWLASQKKGNDAVGIRRDPK